MVKIYKSPLFLAVLAIIANLAQSVMALEKPQSIEDLKKIETSVKLAIGKVGPATVSLLSMKTGASGSGVVISENGLILTAAHVLEGSQDVRVIFPDGEEYKGRSLGMNFAIDAGMVQIEGDVSVPFAKYRSSEDLAVGDFVVAMGHAGGFDSLRSPPVRFGRVTSKNTHHFFSSDCTIIGGDSGGPLVDLNGVVIGIHSSIGKSSVINNHAGLSGFIRDWDRMKKGDVWGELIPGPQYNPDIPSLGTNHQEIRGGGVMVIGVPRRSPARRAGILRGDILLELEGEPIKSKEGLLYMLSAYRPGNEVSVRFKRRGVLRETSVRLGRSGDFIFRR